MKGFTTYQKRIIEVLGKSGRPMAVETMAEKIHLTIGGTVQSLHSLARRGLVRSLGKGREGVLWGLVKQEKE